MARGVRLSEPYLRAARPPRRGGAGSRPPGLRRARRAARRAQPRPRTRRCGGDRGMTPAAQDAPTPATRARPLWWRFLLWAVMVFVIGAAADLLGWDLRGWFHSLWETITTISIGSPLAAGPPLGGRTTDH